MTAPSGAAWQARATAAEEANAAAREERDVLLADADAKNARQIAMQDRISKLEARTTAAIMSLLWSQTRLWLCRLPASRLPSSHCKAGWQATLTFVCG